MICKDECSIVGEKSDINLVGLYLGPLDPLLNDGLKAMMLLGAIPSGLMPSDMAAWLADAITGYSGTVLNQYQDMIKNNWPWSFYLAISVKKCEEEPCMFFCVRKVKKTYRGIHKSNRGPLSGSWRPGTKFMDMDMSAKTGSWRDAQKAVNDDKIILTKTD
jgi:hypothetical protein